jgi:hypothetical protein
MVSNKEKQNVWMKCASDGEPGMVTEIRDPLQHGWNSLEVEDWMGPRVFKFLNRGWILDWCTGFSHGTKFYEPDSCYFRRPPRMH